MGTAMPKASLLELPLVQTLFFWWPTAASQQHWLLPELSNPSTVPWQRWLVQLRVL